jgi:L-asparaginase II
MSNPVLVEVTRGALVESVHRGALSVVAADGRAVLAAGDVGRPVFARSAIKLVQALPLIESGAADRFGFGAAEIALACGSHVGAARHVGVARGMLARLGLAESCLVCGSATPAGARAARDLAASGAPPTPMHHMCSGKHLGFAAAALAAGLPAAGYAEPGHPVQIAVAEALEALAGRALPAEVRGTDGCAVPTYALPLDALARLFARVAAGDVGSATRAAALDRILAACWTEPDLVAGPGRADTAVMTALPGRIYLKTGAEGVYCGALPAAAGRPALGFARKVDDGAGRASAAAVMPLVERLLPAARGVVARGVLRAGDGREVGVIRTSAAYRAMLADLDV